MAWMDESWEKNLFFYFEISRCKQRTFSGALLYLSFLVSLGHSRSIIFALRYCRRLTDQCELGMTVVLGSFCVILMHFCIPNLHVLEHQLAAAQSGGTMLDIPAGRNYMDTRETTNCRTNTLSVQHVQLATGKRQYTRSQLLGYAGDQLPINKRLDPTIWRALRSLGLCALPSTTRGCRGGRNKQRRIATVIGNRDPDLEQDDRTSALKATNACLSDLTRNKVGTIKVSGVNPSNLVAVPIAPQVCLTPLDQHITVHTTTRTDHRSSIGVVSNPPWSQSLIPEWILTTCAPFHLQCRFERQLGSISF